MTIRCQYCTYSSQLNGIRLDVPVHVHFYVVPAGGTSSFFNKLTNPEAKCLIFKHFNINIVQKWYYSCWWCLFPQKSVCDFYHMTAIIIISCSSIYVQCLELIQKHVLLFEKSSSYSVQIAMLQYK